MSTWRGWAWKVEPDWTNPAAMSLAKFTEVISKEEDFRETAITVFASSPIEIGLQIAINSLDVDVEPDNHHTAIHQKARDAGPTIGKNQKPYIQITPPMTFKCARSWIERASTVIKNEILLRFAHPIDIIIGKLFRLDEKDFSGIDRIIQTTGRPNREDIICYLENYQDIFAFDRSYVNKFCYNVEVFCVLKAWEEIPANKMYESYLSRIAETESEGISARNRIEKIFPEDSSNKTTSSKTETDELKP